MAAHITSSHYILHPTPLPPTYLTPSPPSDQPPVSLPYRTALLCPPPTSLHLSPNHTTFTLRCLIVFCPSPSIDQPSHNTAARHHCFCFTYSRDTSHANRVSNHVDDTEPQELYTPRQAGSRGPLSAGPGYHTCLQRPRTAAPRWQLQQRSSPDSTSCQ